MLAGLQKYRRVEVKEFETAEFKELWEQTVSQVQKKIWVISPWSCEGKFKLYVDASASGFGVVLFSGDKVVWMYSRTNPSPHHHSSTCEAEGSVKTLKAMRSFLIGRQFTGYTDNWSVLQVLRGQSRQAPVLRRLKELMHWYPNI